MIIIARTLNSIYTFITDHEGKTTVQGTGDYFEEPASCKFPTIRINHPIWIEAPTEEKPYRVVTTSIVRGIEHIDGA